MKVIEVCAAVIRLDGKILICSRPPGSHMEGWWEFPGGKMEPGESTAECIEREIREELGIAVHAGKELHVMEHQYPEKQVRVHFMECSVSEDHPVLQMMDHQQARWVTPAELLTAQLLPADRPFAGYLAENNKKEKTLQ